MHSCFGIASRCQAVFARRATSGYVPCMTRFALATRAATVAASYKLAARSARTALAARSGPSARGVIAPSIDEPAARPFIPEGHLERILKGCRDCPARTRSGALITERHVARETRAYLLRDACLIDRNVYSGMHKHDLFRGSGSNQRARCASRRVRSTTRCSPPVMRARAGSATSCTTSCRCRCWRARSAARSAMRRDEYRHEHAWRELLQLERAAELRAAARAPADRDRRHRTKPGQARALSQASRAPRAFAKGTRARLSAARQRRR